MAKNIQDIILEELRDLKKDVKQLVSKDLFWKIMAVYGTGLLAVFSLIANLHGWWN